MISFTTAAIRAAALSAAAGVIVGAAGTAVAQVPGADPSGLAVITDSTAVTVTVDAATADATQVTGKLTNTTGNAFSCYTPGVSNKQYPNALTEAAVVRKAMDYYRANLYYPIGGIQAPVGDPVPIGSLYDFLPSGSLGTMLGAGPSAMLEIRAMQELARINGHTGDPKAGAATTITVPANGSVNWTAALGIPASNVRTDFEAAGLFFCQDTVTKKNYVFAGYEQAATPTPPATDPQP